MTIKRASARDQITQILLDRILDGTYKPGDRLVELQIAGELKVSQAPVREAFRNLEAMRVIESEPYKGTRVRQITQKELEDSSRVRASLEELASELAAPRLHEYLPRLEEQAELFMQAARDKDERKYSEHDIEFHRIIMEASDNQLLLSIWESVVLESRFRMTLKSIGAERLETFGQAHLPVIDAIKGGAQNKVGSILKNLICKYHFQKD